MPIKVGDILYYKDLPKEYRCEVLSISPKSLTANFYNLRTKKDIGNYTLSPSKFGVLTEQLPKQERINLKIKFLWNQSKYVQNHPKQAY